MDRGDGEVGQTFDEYRDGLQYTNGGAVYDDRAPVGCGEDMVGVERDPDYYTGQQGLQQEPIHMKELKEKIEKVLNYESGYSPQLYTPTNHNSRT